MVFFFNFFIGLIIKKIEKKGRKYQRMKVSCFLRL